MNDRSGRRWNPATTDLLHAGELRMTETSEQWNEDHEDLIAAATALASLATSAFALEPTTAYQSPAYPRRATKRLGRHQIFYTGSISNQSRDELPDHE